MGEVAIVTGASSGLGREIALSLVDREMHVVGVSRRSFHQPPILSVAGDAARRQTAERAIDVARWGISSCLLCKFA